MKIFIPGDKEKAKRKFEAPKQFACSACGCVFEATKEEYRFEDVCRNEHIYYCMCPTCNFKVMRYE